MGEFKQIAVQLCIEKINWMVAVQSVRRRVISCAADSPQQESALYFARSSDRALR